jgi:hypothetical protein
MQKAADAAALAAASFTGTNPAAREAHARATFDTNIVGTIASVSRRGLRVADGRFIFEAEASVTNTFMKVAGRGTTTIGVGAEAARGGPASAEPHEFVFAFDTTASMNINGCWSCAVSSLANSLEEVRRSAGPNGLFASFMPFSDRVNFGTRAASWIAGGAPAGWNGCLEPREQSLSGNSYALTDASPATLRFKPTAAGSAISNLGSIYGKPTAYCSTSRVTGPTADVATLRQALEATAPGGTGRYDEAMAWAWRMLSPNWSGLWGASAYPAAYGARKKTVVFLTDGFTEAYRYEVGGPTHGVFGGNLGSKAGFENTVAVCDAMKAKGIEVHMIFTRTGNSYFEPYAKRCASSTAHFHKVGDTTQLAAVFTSLTGKGQSSARLVK